MSTAPSARIPTTAILGVGSMGGAILQGLLAPHVEIDGPIRVTTFSEASAAELDKLHGVTPVALASNEHANREAVRGAKLVILGVKPHMIPELLRDIAADVDSDAVVVSVAAGVTLQSMRALLPDSVTVLRAMPNTPSLVGKGVTGIVQDEHTPHEALGLAIRLFETVGDVITVQSEAQLNDLSAVSGSGPAYVFLFIEKLTDAARRMGFTDEAARAMAQQTFLGATLLLDHSGEEPQVLRRNVTSPGGTTERAIAEFMAADLDGIMDRALAAAVARADELGRENG